MTFQFHALPSSSSSIGNALPGLATELTPCRFSFHFPSALDTQK